MQYIMVQYKKIIEYDVMQYQMLHIHIYVYIRRFYTFTDVINNSWSI